MLFPLNFLFRLQLRSYPAGGAQVLVGAVKAPPLFPVLPASASSAFIKSYWEWWGWGSALAQGGEPSSLWSSSTRALKPIPTRALVRRGHPRADAAGSTAAHASAPASPGRRLYTSLSHAHRLTLTTQAHTHGDTRTPMDNRRPHTKRHTPPAHHAGPDTYQTPRRAESEAGLGDQGLHGQQRGSAGPPGGLSWLSLPLLLSVPVMILGSWDAALRGALHSVWSPVQILPLSLSLSLSPHSLLTSVCAHMLFLSRKKTKKNVALLHRNS